MKPDRYVVLDRDGTLNYERHYLAVPNQLALLPGVGQGLRQLRELGLGLVVITNQSGIGRGFFDEVRLEAIHARLRELLEAEGVWLDGIYFCPHTPEDRCQCRKPATGLLERAAQELGFDPQACFVIGDKSCDIELGQRVGATTFLVRTGYGIEVEADSMVTPDYVVDDVLAAAQVIQCLLAVKAMASVEDRAGNGHRQNGNGRDRVRWGEDPHRERIKVHLVNSMELKRRTLETCVDAILAAAELIATTFREGGKVLLCGNGGSAADCQHMAAELVGRLTRESDRLGLPAIALTTDTSFLTAFANDCGFEEIFARQVQALGRRGDVLLGISTSGRSRNVIRAVEEARAAGMSTVVLTGQNSRLAELADVVVAVPGTQTQYLQETHLAIEHIVCDLVEQFLMEAITLHQAEAP